MLVFTVFSQIQAIFLVLCFTLVLVGLQSPKYRYYDGSLPMFRAPQIRDRESTVVEVWCGGSTEALDGHSSPHGMLCACNTPDRFIPVITSDIQGPKAFVVPRTTRFQSLPEVRLHFLLSIWPIPIVESDSSPPALDTLFYRPFSHENRAGIGSEAAQTPFPFLASFATPLVRLSLAYGVSDPRRKKRFSR